MHLQDNTLLQGGKYKIVRFISAGGFGCTYEAEHVMLHKKVAIKEFFVKDFCNRDEQTSQVTVGTQTKVALVKKLKKKFLEEASALSRFRHQNIIPVSDVFEENGTAYYVMEYIDGKSIHDILKTENLLSESRAVKYTTQIAHALQYVHNHNRLHLDIKPGNIMIDSHDDAFLIDFGTSKQYDEEAGENTSTLLGKTPGYAPIEQLGNSVQNFTPATDIYSLGATLYKMLTGITPPEANILVAEDDKLKPLPAYVSAATRNAVKQAMQVKRKDRPQHIEEFLAILEDIEAMDEIKESKEKSFDGEECTIVDLSTSPAQHPSSTQFIDTPTQVTGNTDTDIPKGHSDNVNKDGKKSTSLIFIGIVIGICIFLGIIFKTNENEVPYEEKPSPLLAESVSIASENYDILPKKNKFKIINEEANNNKVYIEWPEEIKGLSDAKRLQNAIRQDFFGGKSVQSYVQDCLEPIESCGMEEPESRIKVKFVSHTDNLIVYLYQVYINVGTGMGSGIVCGDRFLYFDCKHEKTLHINDIIWNKNKALALVNNRINTYYENFQKAQELPEDFIIMPTGIAFVFPKYSIGCGADGEPQILVPYEELNSILTNEFKELIGR